MVTKLIPIAADAVENGGESDGIGVKHGAAAVAGKAETVDIDDVDVAGTGGVTFLQNVGAFVGERGHDAGDDLVFGNGAALDAAFGGGFLGQLIDERIGNRRAAARFVAIPA